MADSQTACAVGRLVEKQATQDRITRAAQAERAKTGEGK